MTPEAYWVRIKNIPLIYERDCTDDPDSVICRTRDGLPVSVTKPEYLSEEERESTIRWYEAFYSPQNN